MFSHSDILTQPAVWQAARLTVANTAMECNSM